MQAADLAFVASGTATLGNGSSRFAPLRALPHRCAHFSDRQVVVHLERIGLVNVVAGRDIAPEFIQGRLSRRPDRPRGHSSARSSPAQSPISPPSPSELAGTPGPTRCRRARRAGDRRDRAALKAMLARAAYTLYGEIYGGLWRAGWFVRAGMPGTPNARADTHAAGPAALAPRGQPR